MSGCGRREAALGRSAALVAEAVLDGGDGEGDGGIRAAALDVDGRFEVRHPLVVDEVVGLADLVTMPGSYTASARPLAFWTIVTGCRCSRRRRRRRG